MLSMPHRCPGDFEGEPNRKKGDQENVFDVIMIQLSDECLEGKKNTKLNC
jgi:hypothetical protein